MEKKAKVKIGFLALLLAVLGVVAVLVVGQAEPYVSSGYTIDGDSVYWELAGKFLFKVTPHTARCHVGENCIQIIQVKNLAGTDLTANVAFVFNENPVYASLEKGNYLPPENGNVARTMTQSGVTSFSATDDACEIGNAFNTNKKKVDYTLDAGQSNATDYTKVVCYNTATDLGDDTWQIDYWVTEQVIGWHFEGNDVTHLLDKGTHADKYYGAYEKTFSAGATEYYRITYAMSPDEQEDENGKRKWEFWGWESGETPASASWIVKLDPWSIDPSDYLFMDTGDVTNTSHSGVIGASLDTTGWAEDGGEDPWVYTNATHFIGNTSAVASDIGDYCAMVAGFTSSTNISLQMAWYDDGATGSLATFFFMIKQAGATKSHFGVYGAGGYGAYYFCDNGTWGSTGVERTVGWHNLTYYVEGTYFDHYIDGVLLPGCRKNIETAIDMIRPASYPGWTSPYIDEIFVWEGTPSDRPLQYAPSITTPTDLQPDPAYSNDTITTYVNYTESLEAGSGTIYGSWYVNDVPEYNETFSDVANGTQVNFTLGPENFTKQQSVNFSVYAESGGYTSETKGPNTLVITNTLPVTVSSTLRSDTNTSGSDLRLYCNASDLDGDNLSYQYNLWKGAGLVVSGTYPVVGGVPEGIETNIYNLSAENVTKGDYTLGCRAYDGDDYSGWLNSSTLEIPNSVPTHDTPLLAPDPAFAYHNLTCSPQNVIDTDNDPVTNITNWLVDNSSITTLLAPFEGGSNSTHTKEYSTTDEELPVLGPTWGASSGVQGGGYLFDGVDDYINMNGSTQNFNGTHGTMMAWFKFSAGSEWNDGENNVIVQVKNGSAEEVVVLSKSSANKLMFRYRAAGKDSDIYLDVSTRSDTDWTFVAITWDSGADEVKAYFNGVQTGPTNTSLGAWNTTEEKEGRIGSNTKNEMNFNGSIDEVYIFNRALSAAQILQMNSTFTKVLVSEETTPGETYQCEITPNDATADGITKQSNELEVKWAITFNVTSSELDVTDLGDVSINCNYTGFDQSGDTTNMYGPYGFPPGSYSCTFNRDTYYEKTQSFIADSDKQVVVIMDEEFSLTDQEHNWLDETHTWSEWLYDCFQNGYCKDILENINQTTTNTWNEFKQTDVSVVVLEDTTNKVVNSTHNLTLNYSIDVPTKEDYNFLPMRLYYWFLNTDNTTCYDQSGDTRSAESPSCHPFVAETVGQVGTLHNFTVELRPNVPASGNYTVVRRIEIDPPENGMPKWINYGHEGMGTIEVTEVGEGGSVTLHEAGQTGAVEASVSESVEGGDAVSAVTGMAAAVSSVFNWSEEGIITIVKVLASLIALTIICTTIVKVKRKEH